MGVCYHAHARFVDGGGNKVTVPAPVDRATPHVPWWYDWIAAQAADLKQAGFSAILTSEAPAGGRRHCELHAHWRRIRSAGRRPAGGSSTPPPSTSARPRSGAQSARERAPSLGEEEEPRSIRGPRRATGITGRCRPYRVIRRRFVTYGIGRLRKRAKTRGLRVHRFAWILVILAG